MSLPEPVLYRPLLEAALHEDLGRSGVITSRAVVPAGATAAGRFTMREEGRVCGLPLVAEVYALLDESVTVTPQVVEGAVVQPGQTLAVVEGPARALLAGERLGLNLLGRLCGIATLTATCVARAAPHGAAVACTRKTTPGLRLFEKYAVRVGGGRNHRFGLDDGILIKDNHIAVAGSVAEAVARARAAAGHMTRIEVEVDSLDQLAALLALQPGADAVLLDNMDAWTLAHAVAMARGRLLTEASGGQTLETVAATAASGVDVISLGFLTHGARSLDVGLDFDAG